MPAEPRILVFHGNPMVTNDFTGREVRYKRADNSDATLDAPTPIPPQGSAAVNYSYPKHEKMSWSTAPNELIQNLVWFVAAPESVIDPALNWDGMTLYAITISAYMPAVTTDASNLRATLQNASNFNIGSPMTVVAGRVLGAGETGVGVTQPFVLTQLAVIASAISGLKGRRQVYYRYEEI